MGMLISVFNYNSYTDFLCSLYLERKRESVNYSLRSFAGHLDLSHSTLSKVLHGERAPSKRTILKIAQMLDLNEAETAHFMALGQSAKKSNRMDDAELFDNLDHWQSLALLEALRIPELKQDLRLVSRKLGIDMKTLRKHFKTLLKKQMIVKRENGYIINVAS